MYSGVIRSLFYKFQIFSIRQRIKRHFPIHEQKNQQVHHDVINTFPVFRQFFIYICGKQCGSSLSGVTKVSWYIALSEFAWAWLRSVARMR